ncbi:MAG: PfkB family carbohydrate kinase [bacterium]|nr:PfkB family carbohydrate kinase [bacterium]
MPITVHHQPPTTNHQLVIVGSIGLDDIETPFGKVKSALGGSAIYASQAASYFTKPSVVSIMGNDIPEEYLKILNRFDISGIALTEKTFRWTGSYEYDMNEAKTIDTKLNALSEFEANVPKNYQEAKYLLLGNIDPDLQLKVLSQMKDHPFTLLDTMNFWITSKRDKLEQIINKVNFLVINEGEARQFCQTPNLIKAGKMLLNLGPKFIVIKKGEHGALLFSNNDFFSAPSYPLEELKDPTGCGDSFAGGLIGYLAKTDQISEKNIRKAIIYGTAVASFCAEDFGTKKTIKLTIKDIEERYDFLTKIRQF